MDENPQTMPPPHYPDGSRVLCADGQTLGEVVATYREYLIVERGSFFPINFYVPYAAIAEAGGGDIVLALNGRDALAQGWHIPPADPVIPVTTVPAPPPAEPVATTAAPVVPVDVAPVDATPRVDSGPVTPAVTTTAAPTVNPAEVPGASVETETAEADPPPEPDRISAEVAAIPLETTTTTAAPVSPNQETVAVEEAVEVQSFQPDASVPPPAEPEDAGTVSLAPSFVGIPGRRLSDAELWSLLDPKGASQESDEDSEDPKGETSDPDKPGS